MGDVTLLLRNPAGVLLMPSLPVTSLEWALEENAFGVLRATGPLSEIDLSYLAQDARFEVIRSVNGGAGYVEGDTQFLLRYWAIGESGGVETWEIEAYSLDYLLTGRIVDYPASTDNVTNAYSTKTGAADDLMKDVVAENLGASATEATRILSELSIDADQTAGVSVTRSFAWEIVADVLKDLAEDSLNQGTYLSFGITRSGASGTGAIFKTWATQRGVDHSRGSSKEIIVSKALHNLADPKVVYDYRAAYTTVRALGTGEGASRVTVRSNDTTRSTASPFAYREKNLEGNSTADTTVLTSDARAELERGRAVRSFTGRFVDTEYATYGVHVGFGDLVTAEYMGASFTCRMSRVAGRWSKETAEELTIDLVGSEAI